MTPNHAPATTVDFAALDKSELVRRLEEAEETILAIHTGAVDAFVMGAGGRHRVYTLEGADRPYRLFVERMEEGAATMLADGTIAYSNGRLADLLKTEPEALMGARFGDFVAPEDRHIYENLMWQGRDRAGRSEARLRRTDGVLTPAFLTFSALPEDCGAAIAVLVTDLTVQKHHEQLTAAHQALRESQRELARQKEVLETAISAAPLQAIMGSLATAARQLAGSDARSAVLLVDREQGRLGFCATSGMPESYMEAVSGQEVSADECSCGRAAFTGEPEIVVDVERDPRWASRLDIARAHEVRSLWSYPIVGSDGAALGTIAIYHRTPREPGPGEHEPIRLLAQTASAVLERHDHPPQS